MSEREGYQPPDRASDFPELHLPSEVIDKVLTSIIWQRLPQSFRSYVIHALHLEENYQKNRARSESLASQLPPGTSSNNDASVIEKIEQATTNYQPPDEEPSLK